VESVEHVFVLLDIAKAAQRWVSDPLQVGDWMLEPNPGLGNATPAHAVRELGQEGAQDLVGHMETIGPRERVATAPVELNADELRETLRRLGAPSIAPASPSDTADLSDFD